MLYAEAYDRILQAYFRDEIKPFNAEFCFCGTLQGNMGWVYDWAVVNYTATEYDKMEAALLGQFFKFGVLPTADRGTWIGCGSIEVSRMQKHKDYEDVLFNGMCAALEVLKQIHIERGEDVEGVVEFKKRELVKAI